MGHLLEGLHVGDGGYGGSCDCILESGECDDVSCLTFLDSNPVGSDHEVYSLDTLCGLDAGDVEGVSLLDGSGEQPSDCDLSCLLVHDDLVDHQCDVSLGVAGEHVLSDLGVEVSVPDGGDPDLLGVDGVLDVVDGHLENDICDGDDLCELVLSALLSAQVEDGVEVEGLSVELVSELGCELECPLGDLRPAEVGDGDCPVVVCGTECDGSVLEADLPLLVEGCREDVHDLLVEGGDDLGELLDHHLGGELLLDDGPVDLVDEEHGLDTLFECLPDDSLGLGHDSLDSTAEDVYSVQCPHCPGDVSTEVDVSGGIDEVDEVVLDGVVVLGVPVGNDHCCGSGVDGDSTGCLLLVVVEDTLGSSVVRGHHSGTCDQVVGEGGLSVVDVCCGSEVPDEGLILHQLYCFLCVVLFTSHVHSPYENHLADCATLSVSSFFATEKEVMSPFAASMISSARQSWIAFLFLEELLAASLLIR